MKLIGMLDSPFVRRVAISAKLLDLPFEHEPLSVFRHFDRFRTVNPVVKAPTLVTDDGATLLDSSLIVDYLDHRVAPERRLLPDAPDARLRALVPVGFALAAAEKTVQVVYEQMLRPTDKQHEPWLERVLSQLEAAYDALEPLVAAAHGWFGGARLLQPDVTTAVAWRFTQFMAADFAPLARIDPARYPALAAHSARAEALPAFVETPLD
ncbi:glutathione S-transferase family protein [Burkholderia pseudomultivorans]|uniref:Glutathione S-transferase n=1 Tax=Burkholderia pseudomultivorans TaxID=1207504 RepID=A0A132F3C6_9BURK|nr:glutathione S-transferase [Burkholderia pseudomultivorans]AOI91822.1 glutathione S-transferase [Burkholderia pseudomultivorans]KVG62003.1 glutathione S-transferase [Burkholderia pseudomultivorans]KWF09817.1 glutathione S-transferase [Burkholderia pseudomultivorans]KWF68088.1 glutathione S-transferase [Burkholderia pseudomultivorans]MBF5013770.1 glutathione S-transferase [Burkholderia pseudomultivorans]